MTKKKKNYFVTSHINFFNTPSCERPTKMPGLCGCLSEVEACESFVTGDPPEKGLTHLKI